MRQEECDVPVHEPFECDPQSARDPFDHVYWGTVSLSIADDYYILFRDPTPFEDGDDAPLSLPVFRKRLQETLIVDQASFVWRYAGKLTQPQAAKVQDKINIEFKKRFSSPSCVSKYISSTKYGSELRLRGFLLCDVNFDDTIWVVPHAPGALTFLAQRSPKLDYLSRVPVNHCVRLQLWFEKESLLDSEIERLRFREELFQRAYRKCFNQQILEIPSALSTISATEVVKVFSGAEYRIRAVDGNTYKMTLAVSNTPRKQRCGSRKSSRRSCTIDVMVLSQTRRWSTGYKTLHRRFWQS